MKLRGWGCRNRAGVVPARRPVAEHAHVPAARLLEHRPLLGQHRGVELPAHVREVGCGRDRELGVHVAHGGEERVAQAGAVHRIVAPFAALENPGQAARAHRVGLPQQVGGDPGERLCLHPAQATEGM